MQVTRTGSALLGRTASSSASIPAAVPGAGIVTRGINGAGMGSP